MADSFTKYGLGEPTAPEFGPDCPNILAWADGKDRGAKHERALIVAFLHTWQRDAGIDLSACVREGAKEAAATRQYEVDIVGQLAEAIQNGDHREQ